MRIRHHFDITKITGATQNAGIFASYHAYPYYPNFISQQPCLPVHTATATVQNSYLGYITDTEKPLQRYTAGDR
ncbi:MAG: hypothetical protein MZV63_05295 [Marinilabiliales bacterium]|nr:hypothetical protein [Marinilabiliales bacterium]